LACSIFSLRKLHRKRLPLKNIIAIRIATFYHRNRTRRQISKRKNYAPAFVLAHMRVLVSAKACGGGGIAGEDDVAEGDGVDISPWIHEP
jgi:hypothetical protein